jgi:hypothetical protein
MPANDASRAVLKELRDRPVEPSFAQVAIIVTLGPDGNPLIQFAGSSECVSARLALSLTRERIEQAIEKHQQTVVVFENGDRSKPLIIGLIEMPPFQATQPQHEIPEEEPGETEVTASPETPEPVIEADVDGKRVRVTAQDEIVLQCGPASITLRRNGRVVIKGTYVETHSEGTNRIKGGQVQIN